MWGYSGTTLFIIFNIIFMRIAQKREQESFEQEKKTFQQVTKILVLTLKQTEIVLGFLWF